MSEMNDLYRKYKNAYNFIGVFNYGTPQILVTSTRLARDILTTYFDNFHDNEFGDITNKRNDQLFSRNPFMLKGREWKRKRAEISPAFTITRIRALYPHVEDVCSRMTNFVRQNTTLPIETKDLAGKFTTDVVSSCVFAVDAQSFTNKDALIRSTGRKLLDSSLLFVLKLMCMLMFPKLGKAFRFSFIPKRIERFFIKLMQEAIHLKETSSQKCDDFLEYLIKLQEKESISDIDMAAYGVTFFIDGFETSSTAFALTLYELARNPNVQSILRQELLASAEKDGSIKFDVLMNLPYLEQVLNEGLRLWPPGAFISKKCTKPVSLNLTSDRKITIEAGTCAILCVWSLQRDPDCFENPDAFDPDRFSAEKGGANIYRENGCYLPFGDGPRKCLGMRFARMQIKRGIFEVLTNFKISVNSRTKEPLRIVSSPALTLGISGIWLDYVPL
ncbi:probable cytochrome P450 28a5 isoform X2 [Armigeres subalbatus]